MVRGSRKDTTLCTSFCVYYKPGKSEDLACQGYIAVQRIISKGKALSQERSTPMQQPDARTRLGLEERVCSHCSFSEQDCDYIATRGNASPCGGFLLLSHLLGIGELTLEEIE